jgi:hypothetical protein
MYGDVVVKAIQENLKTKLSFSHILAFEEVFPTSGVNFVRVSGARTTLMREDNTLKVAIGVTIAPSVRMRQVNHENPKPYLDLIHFAEKVFTHVMTDATIISAIKAELPDRASMIGHFTSAHIPLKPRKLFPEDYSSTENAERRPVGIELQTDFTAPLIQIPVSCGVLPDGLETL